MYKGGEIDVVCMLYIHIKKKNDVYTKRRCSASHSNVNSFKDEVLSSTSCIYICMYIYIHDGSNMDKCCGFVLYAYYICS